MNGFNSGWYLIYTLPRHEKKLSARLQEKQIESLLPMVKSLRELKDKRQYMDVPLFPSYVFVFLKDMKNYYSALDSNGSLYFVRNGKEIARVSETVIDNIRLVAAAGKEVEVSSEHYQPGQKLIIQKGPLTGLSCEVVQCKEKKKILVRVSLLQRNILMELPPEQLYMPFFN